LAEGLSIQLNFIVFQDKSNITRHYGRVNDSYA